MACAKFLKKYTRLLCRASATESERIHSQLVRDPAALDRSIAERIATDPDDPMMDHPDYWADRSVVRSTPEEVACDTCGDIAQKFIRTGRSRGRHQTWRKLRLSYASPLEQPLCEAE